VLDALHFATADREHCRLAGPMTGSDHDEVFDARPISPGPTRVHALAINETFCGCEICLKLHNFDLLVHNH
jgi:hypothetical protein